MIPLQLTLKNFLSYREATLDFRGLHTACICGANGAGKSSLLEAITWTIWGQSRAANEDDVIYAGANNVRVDFQFISNNQVYRIIRSRLRGRSSSLEFQIESSGGFRSLTGKGLRATQEQIITALKLDYETFINSAYLRQGRADEFMLRRPNERKQILADLLKLNHYETLANQAKDLSKQFKGQAEQLELSLSPLEEQLKQTDVIAFKLTSLTTEIEQLKLIQERNRVKFQELKLGEHQRQTWQQQFSWQKNQYETLIQDCDRFLKDQSILNIQLKELQNLLNQEPEISAGYHQLLHLRQEEETLSNKFQSYQDSQQQKQHFEQQLSKQINELDLKIRQNQTRLESLEQQEQEIQQVMSRSPEVKAGLEKLNLQRNRLKKLDQLQQQVAPLGQRRYTLQTEIERIKARLNAKLEQIRSSEEQLSLQISKVPQIRQSALLVDAEIKGLEKKLVYQKRVEEKGVERKNFQERLKENQRIVTGQLEKLQQKLGVLETPNSVCPLCEQALNEHYRYRVVDKTQIEQKEIQEQIWVLQEQITVCERELQILRTEYQQLNNELKVYDSLQQQLGQLEAQLEACGETHARLRQIKSEIEEIEQILSNNNYAQNLQSELTLLNQELQRLNYDEQTHALVRGEVERLRWAEIKQAKIEDATRRQATINAEKPKLLEIITQLRNEIQQLRHSSEIKQEIERLEQYLSELNYERSQHQELMKSLRQAQFWQLRYQELKQAQQQNPLLLERLQQIEQALQDKQEAKAVLKAQLDGLVVQIENVTDNREEIQSLDEQIQKQQQQLNELIAQQGRLEQSLAQLKSLQIHYQESTQQLKEVRKQYKVYQELSQAFGKNGIQALMIENILPQLEAETNQILTRLTGNQLHVQFLTQKAGRGSKKSTLKLIDTLDILIADARGTRAYETYSGGEAFRINFSIRLALARLLAQRAGTALQMLIVDEGFGTQDPDGCDRLIAAINAISSDFSCILTVTHMPQFKEAFQHRIEVRKTNQGSQISLLN